MKKIIVVEDCQKCPFKQDKGIVGQECQLNKDLKTNSLGDLPYFKVHENCPLKESNVTVKLKR